VLTTMVVSADGASGSRVLIHGPPGVGKDTVMAEVAHSIEVRSLGGLQGWLQASSDVVFRRQLIGLFEIHRPSVTAGTKGNEQGAIEAIRHWLSSHSDWVLFVSDARLDTTTLWEVLPANSLGRIIVTSRQPLHQHHFDFDDTLLELGPITTDNSIEMFRRMSVFSCKAPNLPNGEDEVSLHSRCIAAGAPEWYTSAPPNEEAGKRKARCRTIETKLLENAELARPELRVLLEGLLGNLPLSVSLCCHLLRADPTIGGVLDLVALFHRPEYIEASQGSQSALQEEFDVGLQLSIRIIVDHLSRTVEVSEGIRRGAVALLSAMSVLHDTLTLQSLLSGHDMGTLLGADIDEKCISEDAMVELVQIMSVFMDEGMLLQARETCIQYGLLRPFDRESVWIGGMHREVQVCLRRELVAGTAAGQAVALAVRRMLLARFNFDDTTPPTMWAAPRALVPSVSAWCSVIGCNNADNAATTPVVPEDADDGVVLTRWGAFALHAEGNASEAERIWSGGLALARRVLSPQDPQLVALTRYLVSVNTALGQIDQAVELEEAALEFEKQTLPTDDLSIVASMSNLASTYSHLDRHDDAARLLDGVLALLKRVLPPTDPAIATCMGILATEYAALGRHKNALQLQQDALDVLTTALSPEDPRRTAAMCSLVTTHFNLGQHDDALQLGEETLAIRLSVLPQDHAGIATTMAQLVTVYAALGRHEDALQFGQDAVNLLKQALLPNDPHIRSAMSDLATAYSNLGRHDEAAHIAEETLAIRLSVLPHDHMDVVASMEQAASAFEAATRYEDALGMREQLVTLWKEISPPKHSNISTALRNLASTMRHLGRFDEAARLAEEASAIGQQIAPREFPPLAGTQTIVASVYTVVGQFDEPQRKLNSPRNRAARPSVVPSHDVKSGSLTPSAAAPAAATEHAMLKPRSPDAEHSAIRVRLVDYLAGHSLRTALMAFEDALGPWVKLEMAKHFRDISDDAQRANDKSAAAVVLESSAARRAVLEVELKSLEQMLRSTSRDQKAQRAALAQKKTDIVKQLKQLNKQESKGSTAANAQPPVPLWVAECRKAAGRKMALHINEHNRWDTHIIVLVMQAHLKAVFAKYLPDDFHAKELLTRMAGLISARARRAHRIELVESDVLGALDQAATILQQCHAGGAGAPAAAALHMVSELLDEAKRLVDTARSEAAMLCGGPSLSADVCNAQLFYASVTQWETHVERELEAPMHYQDGKIAFGVNLDDTWVSAVKRLKKELERVARARHWYFHHLEGDIDFTAVYAAMTVVTDALASVHRSKLYTEWRSPPVMDRPCAVELTLDTQSTRKATVPVARVREIVGRDVEVDVLTTMVVSADGASGSRVLIHGPPGVGKDTVMAEVAHSIEVRSLGGLQGWLQASSDVVFRRQLIGLFEIHRPSVTAGTKGNEQGAIEAIRTWLSSNNDWTFFVEDAGLATTTLWEVLPAGAVGRVIVTSQQSLHDDHAVFADTHLELEPINTDDSIEMFRRMNLFSRKAPSPPVNENEAALNARCAAAGAPQCYVEAPPNEKKGKRKERRRAIEAKLFEHSELARPELFSFLRDTLGNLPLSVSLCGHMLRADSSLRGVLDLIALYPRLDLDDVDAAGRNPQQDKHYFGLQLSIRINLDRLTAAKDVSDEEQRGALSLLAAISMLDHALTPLSLLVGHNVDTIFGKELSENRVPEEQLLEEMQALAVFMDKAMLDGARDVCVRYGLLRRVHSKDAVVGVMHQQVQKGLRQDLVAGTRAGQAVARAVRRMLRARFTFRQSTPPSEWPAQRVLVPCVSAWCAVVTEFEGGGEDQRIPVLSENKGDGVLLAKLGSLILHANGNAREAERFTAAKLALTKRLLPADHPDIATATGNLAAVYGRLGRLGDAVRLQEDVLKSKRRVLHPDHPDIAQAMHNLVTTYYGIGRLDDAARLGKEVLAIRKRVLPPHHPAIAQATANLAAVYSHLGRDNDDTVQMKEDVLSFRKRVLPADDPQIAEAMSNLMTSYYNVGRLDDAAQLGEEAVAFRRWVLPPDHPHLAIAMSNLASVYSSLGRHEDALLLKEDVLAIETRVLPEDHPTIATSMINLASTYFRLGRHGDAARLAEKALAIRQRRLPPDHPDIPKAKQDLATVYTALGRYEEALQLAT